MSSFVMVHISTIEATADKSGLMLSNIVEIIVVDEDQTIEIRSNCLDQLTAMDRKSNLMPSIRILQKDMKETYSKI